MDDFVGRKTMIPPARMRELTKRSDLKGWIQTASHFGALIVTGTALWLAWGTWWAVPLFVAHGVLLNFLFAAQHEMGHMTVFKTKWLNGLFGHIAAFLQLWPRNNERLYHQKHHRFTQDWTRDPELLDRAQYTFASYLSALFGPTYWYRMMEGIVRNAMGQVAPYFTEQERPTLIAEARWYLAGYVAVLAVSLATQSWAAAILWLAPMMTTKVFQVIQNLTEHTGLTHEQDTWHNTRTIATCALYRWMAWNMQYHTAHHTFPAVPFHNLPALHAEMVKDAGYAPPTVGYLTFQWRFLRQLLTGPEPVDGQSEIEPPVPAAAE